MQSLSFSELSKQLSYLPKFSFETALKVYVHLATTTKFGRGQVIFTSTYAGAEPPRRYGGECFGNAVVSFAPTKRERPYQRGIRRQSRRIKNS